MAYVAPTTKTTGTLITAAIWNADVVANPIALYAGAMSIPSQAALDFLYASSATQLARLAKGAAYQVPRMNSTAAGWEFADGSVVSGSWTPVIGGSGGTSGQTYAAQEGWYLKIGLLVIVNFYAGLSNKGTITTNVQIQGLPFTSASVSAGYTALASSIGWQTLASNWVNIRASVEVGATAATVMGATAAAAANATPLTTADIQNTTALSGTIAYKASA